MKKAKKHRDSPLIFIVFHLSLTMSLYFKTVKLDYGDNLTYKEKAL